MKKKIGFVGLGKMGSPMARNIHRAGFPLTVYDGSERAIEDLVKLGAKASGSPKDVGLTSEIVLLSLPSPEAVRQVVLVV